MLVGRHGLDGRVILVGAHDVVAVGAGGAQNRVNVFPDAQRLLLALGQAGMVGYDPDDPVTACGVGRAAESYSKSLEKAALKGARIGILRESFGYAAEPDTDDFKQITEVFDRAVADLRKAGADIVDPVVIPDLNALIAKRARIVEDDDRMACLGRCTDCHDARRFRHVRRRGKHRRPTQTMADRQRRRGVMLS